MHVENINNTRKGRGAKTKGTQSFQIKFFLSPVSVKKNDSCGENGVITINFRPNKYYANMKYKYSKKHRKFYRGRDSMLVVVVELLTRRNYQ